MNNVLAISTREEFRLWLKEHSQKSRECYLIVKRGKPTKHGFYYLDAVEEALCFGWIDSVQKSVDGVIYQRFSPRNKRSPWTELNKERARRLIKLGLMEKEGRKVLPPLGSRSYKLDEDIKKALSSHHLLKAFKSFPPLYQRVRSYNVAFYKKKDPVMYKKSLTHLINETKKGKMYGEWNDYGRLLNY